MPAPAAGQLRSLVADAFAAAGLEGQAIPDLVGALTDALAQALQQFATMALVEPGIPATVVPPAMSGATTGPGKLMAPPAGGPDAASLEGPTADALAAAGLKGSGIEGLATALAGAIAQGIAAFTESVQVAPGIAIAGAATAAPGSLLPPAPQKSKLLGDVESLLQDAGLEGTRAGDLADAGAGAIAAALGQLLTGLVVAPGIPAPGPTAAPGRLL